MTFMTVILMLILAPAVLTTTVLARKVMVRVDPLTDAKSEGKAPFFLKPNLRFKKDTSIPGSTLFMTTLYNIRLMQIMQSLMSCA